MKYCLDPVVTAASRVLILGTLPGDESLRLQRYYANPGNQFWVILGAVFDVGIGPSYDDMIRFLHSRGLALWDVLSGADREGSLDGRIQNAKANDFETFLTKYPKVLTVVFNGGEAEKRFRRHVQGSLSPEILRARRLIALPSTSATPGRNVLPFSGKTARWKAIQFAEETF
jgi:hypoxanthine-DNA glycosylase